MGGKGWGKGWGKGKGGGKSLRNFDVSVRVWIGGLAAETTWKELQEHFNQAGKTKWVEVFNKPGNVTGGVAYETADEATSAIATLNGSILKGTSIQCDVWEKKETPEGEGKGGKTA